MLVWSVINEAFMISSATAVAFGWYFIRRGQRDTHRRLMITASILGLAFFISYVLQTLLVGDTAFGGPKAYGLSYATFLQTHATLATVAGVLGVITLRRAFKGRFDLHRRIAPWTATIWFVAAGSGLMVFLLLYVIFQPGPTTNILRAMGIGHL
ncbi:MAG: DUF420 domain-containing protein [Thermaerobacter sp.]|nr:DUF420 domain-containing protein [Thermaerobacter sp.]